MQPFICLKRRWSIHLFNPTCAAYCIQRGCFMNSCAIGKKIVICFSFAWFFLFVFLPRKTIPSSGPLGGTISWSQCLTQTSSGLGLKNVHFFYQINFSSITLICLLKLKLCLCFFSIMNSLVIVLFLSGMVAMIMLRTLHKDIARYNQVDQVKASFNTQINAGILLYTQKNQSNNIRFTANYLTLFGTQQEFIYQLLLNESLQRCKTNSCIVIWRAELYFC